MFSFLFLTLLFSMPFVIEEEDDDDDAIFDDVNELKMFKKGDFRSPIANV